MSSVYVVTFLVSVASGFVPLVNVEAYLLLASATVGSREAVLPLALVAALGQMVAKVVIYLGGRGILRLPLGRYAERIERAKVRAERWEGSTGTLVLVSASVGLPPFYVITALMGMIRYNLTMFILLGLVGRFARFALVAAFPELLQDAARHVPKLW